MLPPSTRVRFSFRSLLLSSSAFFFDHTMGRYKKKTIARSEGAKERMKDYWDRVKVVKSASSNSRLPHPPAPQGHEEHLTAAAFRDKPLAGKLSDEGVVNDGNAHVLRVCRLPAVWL